jgi:catechol 2,3-dioxygenase-like lactoylglutathione lyase family enzyme
VASNGGTVVTSIGHVAINAKDIDKSLDFYKRVLGLPEAFRVPNADGSLWMVYLKTGPDDFIEIFARAAKAAPRTNDDEGMKHYCLWVDSLDTTLKDIESRGVAIDYSKVRTGRSGCRQYFVADPDGVLIELMELMPDSMQARAMRGA